MPAKKSECCPGRSIRVPEEIAKMVDEHGGLDNICAAVPETDRLQAEAAMHRAMSDKYRLIILHALSRCDLCPCLLKSITGLADSKLSYHLAVLEAAGLIGSRQNGQWRIYALTEVGKKASGHQ
jgi:ArsR family transcriptional regulator